MELIAKLVNTQLGTFIPVVLVIIFATLVYTFGFKSPEQPQFDKLSSGDDRKSTGKKRKIKDKKPSNGFAVSVSETKADKSSPKDKELKRSPTKDTPETPKKAKKVESNTPKQGEVKKTEVKAKKVDSLEEIKNKKNKPKFEKPVDYDDGNWETVPNKGDKKKKIDSPVKKEKKPKTQEKSGDAKDNKEVQKLVKVEIEKQLQDNNKENKSTEGNKKTDTKAENARKEIIPIIEETKPKKEKKSKKEKLVEEVVELPPSVESGIKAEPAKAHAKVKEVKNEPAQTEVNKPSGEAVFDELGDVWTEAKAVKKSKKKSRRD